MCATRSIDNFRMQNISNDLSFELSQYKFMNFHIFFNNNAFYEFIIFSTHVRFKKFHKTPSTGYFT